MAMSLAMILERKLKERHMTTAEFARRVGISDTSVSRYILDGTIPRYPVLKRMSEVLECPFDELLKGCL